MESEHRASAGRCRGKRRMSAGTGENANFAHPIVPILLGLLLVAGGGYLYWSGMQATANAEEVDATVLSSSVVDTDDTGSSQDANEYTVRVEYRYAYDGREYTTENLCPGAGTECEPSSDFRTDMQEFVEEYPEGETVTAYVPPSAPSNAYLVDTEPSLIFPGIAAAGVLLSGLGVKRLLGE